MKKQTE